jgi:hypothetical protein
MIRQETYKVTLYRDTQSQLVREDVRFTPDGWLDFRITVQNQTQQACILLEMDMDTHQKPAFRKRLPPTWPLSTRDCMNSTFRLQVW